MPGLLSLGHRPDECCACGCCAEGCADALELFETDTANIDGHVTEPGWVWAESVPPSGVLSVSGGELVGEPVSYYSVTPEDGTRPQGSVRAVTSLTEGEPGHGPHLLLSWYEDVATAYVTVAVVHDPEDPEVGSWWVLTPDGDTNTGYTAVLGDEIRLSFYDDGTAAVALNGVVIWLGSSTITPGADATLVFAWDSDLHGGNVASEAEFYCQPPALPCGGDLTNVLLDSNGAPLLDSDGECLLDSDPLAGFAAALATADTTPVEVVLLTDSVGEGYDATTREDSYAALVAEAFATAHNAGPHGPGWLPIEANPAAPGPYLEWSTPAGVGPATVDAADATSGLGGWAHTLTGDTAEHDADYEGVSLQYTGGQGAADVDVGGVSDTINLANAAATAGHRWESGPLGAGPHTLSVQGGGGAQIDGAFLYAGGNRTAGVRFYNAGHSSFGMQDYADHAPTWEALAKRPPDLLILALGIADILDGGSTGALWQASLEALLDQAQAVMGTRSIVYCFEWETAGMPADHRWALDYRFRALDVCTARGVKMVDWYGVIGDLFADGVLSAYAAADGIHLNDDGHTATGTELETRLPI